MNPHPSIASPSPHHLACSLSTQLLSSLHSPSTPVSIFLSIQSSALLLPCASWRASEDAWSRLCACARTPTERACARAAALALLSLVMGKSPAFAGMAADILADPSAHWQAVGGAARALARTELSPRDDASVLAKGALALANGLPEEAVEDVMGMMERKWKKELGDEVVGMAVEWGGVGAMRALEFAHGEVGREMRKAFGKQVGKVVDAVQKEQGDMWKNANVLGRMGKCMAMEEEGELIAVVVEEACRRRHGNVTRALGWILEGWLGEDQGGNGYAFVVREVASACRLRRSAFPKEKMENWFYFDDNKDEETKEILKEIKSCSASYLDILVLMLSNERLRTTLDDTVAIELLLTFSGWLRYEPGFKSLAFPWSSNDCHSKANAGLDLLAAALGDNEPKVLDRDRSNVARCIEGLQDQSLIWDLCRETLGEGKWKSTEWVYCNGFLVVLQECQRKSLAGDRSLGHIIPMLLPLADHLSPQVSIPGLNGVNHLLEEMTATEFRWYSDLLLFKLESIVSSSREAATLAVAVPTLLKGAALSESLLNGPMTNNKRVMESCLRIASMSTSAAVLLIFLRAIQELSHRLQFHTIQFFSEILEIAGNCAARGGSAFFDLRQCSLLLLNDLLELCRPVVSRKNEEILVILARHHLVSREDTEQKQAAEILRALQKWCKANPEFELNFVKLQDYLPKTP